MRITESQLRKIVREEARLLMKEDKGGLYDYELAILAYMRDGATEEEDIRVNAGRTYMFDAIPRANFKASVDTLVKMGLVTRGGMSGDMRAMGPGRGARMGMDVDFLTLTPKGAREARTADRYIGR
jgi:hypothetical protein